MANKLIKICGISDPEMARLASTAGADLIGIVFHPLSPRNVTLDQAVSISDATYKAGALPVAVFVNQTDVEMRHICEATNIHIVQLHGVMAKTHHHLLPDYYLRIYVQNVSENGEIKKDDGLKRLDSGRDLILIDHINPGQGNSINRQKFHYDLPFPWILAGGLSPSNVVELIGNLQPNGVDVSSGVESSKGNKDIILIQKFITSVKGAHHVM